MRLIATVFAAALTALAVLYLAPLPSASQSPLLPIKSGSAADRILKTGVLRCGYFVLDGQLNKDINTGELSGPIYDIVNALARNLSVKVEWVKEAGMASIGEDLKRGHYDMLCTTIVGNGPRARVMDLSRTVLKQPMHVWVHKDDPRRGRKDVSWLNAPKTTFSTVDGSGFTTIIANYFPNARMIELPELSALGDMMTELKSKKVDAILMVPYPASRFAEKNQGAIVRYTNPPVTYAPNKFAWARGDYKMARMMNIALDELIYTGELNMILDKYDPRGFFFTRVE